MKRSIQRENLLYLVESYQQRLTIQEQFHQEQMLLLRDSQERSLQQQREELEQLVYKQSHLEEVLKLDNDSLVVKVLSLQREKDHLERDKNHELSEIEQ